MKKNIFIFLTIALSFMVTNSSYAKTASSSTVITKIAPVAKKTTIVPVKTKTVAKPKIVAKKPIVLSKVTWTPAAIKASKKIPSQIRNAVMIKIENYARRKKIKTITPAVMNGMRE